MDIFPILSFIKGNPLPSDHLKMVIKFFYVCYCFLSQTWQISS
jgi:hypothetical protein